MNLIDLKKKELSLGLLHIHVTAREANRYRQMIGLMGTLLQAFHVQKTMTEEMSRELAITACGIQRYMLVRSYEVDLSFEELMNSCDSLWSQTTKKELTAIVNSVAAHLFHRYPHAVISPHNQFLIAMDSIIGVIHGERALQKSLELQAQAQCDKSRCDLRNLTQGMLVAVFLYSYFEISFLSIGSAFYECFAGFFRAAAMQMKPSYVNILE